MVRHFVPLIAAVACIAGVALTARAPTTLTDRQGMLILPRPLFLKALGRSHISLITDFYWLRTINRATTAFSPLEARALLTLGDLIVDLDPDHSHAYWLIGLNAPVPAREKGKWANAVEAADLLRRGLARFPRENKLVIALAHNLTFYQRDYPAAAAVLEARAKLPDALPYFGPLATRLLATSGHFESSRLVARAMLESATDDETRKMFEERLKLIDLEERLALIDAADQRYFADQGRHAQTVDDLVAAGYLDQAPSCPFGGVIILRNGKAQSTATKRLQLFEKD